MFEPPDPGLPVGGGVIGGAVLAVVDVFEVHTPVVLIDGAKGLFGGLPGAVGYFSAGHGIRLWRL